MVLHVAQAQESAALSGQDIPPKNPDANYSVQEHIEDGKRSTQFNSATKSKVLQNFMLNRIHKEVKTRKVLLLKLIQILLTVKFMMYQMVLIHRQEIN